LSSPSTSDPTWHPPTKLQAQPQTILQLQRVLGVAVDEVEAGQDDSMGTVQSLRFEAEQEVAVEVAAGATAETTSKIETLEKRR
jgi:hypothetical protein